MSTARSSEKMLEKRHDKLRYNYLDRNAKRKIEKQMQGIAGKLIRRKRPQETL